MLSHIHGSTCQSQRNKITEKSILLIIVCLWRLPARSLFMLPAPLTLVKSFSMEFFAFAKREVNNWSNMEVFRSEEFYIFVQDDVSLWWSRVNGEFLSKSGEFSIKHFRFYECQIVINLTTIYYFCTICVQITLYFYTTPSHSRRLKYVSCL